MLAAWLFSTPDHEENKQSHGMHDTANNYEHLHKKNSINTRDDKHNHDKNKLFLSTASNYSTNRHHDHLH